MKGEQVICTDDNFAEDTLIKWAKFGVKHPTKGKLYHIRDVIRHSLYNGKTMVGIRLEEINNPSVPVDVPFPMDIEPTFSIKRFTTLLGLPLIEEKEVYEEVR